MTNNADNKSAANWLNDITDEFMKGQNFVILVPQKKDAVTAMDALREILLAPSVTFYISSLRIEERYNKGTIWIFPASAQHHLRGMRRDTKLVDPNGLASDEMRHRFK